MIDNCRNAPVGYDQRVEVYYNNFILHNVLHVHFWRLFSQLKAIPLSF